MPPSGRRCITASRCSSWSPTIAHSSTTNCTRSGSPASARGRSRTAGSASASRSPTSISLRSRARKGRRASARSQKRATWWRPSSRRSPPSSAVKWRWSTCGWSPAIPRSRPPRCCAEPRRNRNCHDQEECIMKARHLAFATVALLSASLPALADDQVKLTIGQRGNWDTAISHLGDKAGIFKTHGLALDMIYTAGSGETLQPVIAGSVDLGLAVGTLGAIAAYSKGAPVRIIGAEATGAADYWYVKASSPIKTLKDLNGKTIAYSTAGSSTESVVRAFIKENGLTSAKAMSTGGAPSTMTAVMTDQVDVGWASPPGGLKDIDEGKIRLLARATDAAIVRGQTIRTIVANAQVLEKRKGVVERYMQAYRETIDYMYGDNPQVLKDYAAFAGVSEAMAKRVRDEFFPRALVMPDEIKGLDSLMADAVELKFISAPLSKAQIADLVQLQKPKP